MPNYLARVAAAGARTPSQSTAKPPVPAPPVLPGAVPPGMFVPPNPAPEFSSTPPASPGEDPNRQRTAPPPVVEPGRNPHDEPVALTMQTQMPAPAPTPPAHPEPAQGPRMEAPAEPAVPLAVVEEVEVIRIPKRLRAAAFATQAPTAAEQFASTEAATSETIVRAPHNRSKTEPAQAVEPASEQPVAVPGPPAPPSLLEQPGRQATEPATAPMLTPKPSITQPRFDVSPQAHTSGEIVLPVEPREGGNRRQTKITVGRLDVQVNNHPPVTPPSSRPQRSEWQSNPLEVRFLSRFHLRP